MRTFRKYINGFLIGICIEYLIRVNFNIFPLIIIVCILLEIYIEEFK